MSFIDSCKLNREQLKAVKHTEGPLLVLAGAGSGKTRVLTHRIAHMIMDKDIPAYSILAITFTNKAATEMRERIYKMVGDEARDGWIMTFHSCCVRILRNDIENLGYDNRFSIFDDSDQTTLIGKLLKEMAPYTKLTPKAIKDFISSCKNRMQSPEDARSMAFNMEREFMCDVYERYDEELKRNNALDFDDLLNLTVELFEKHPDVLEKYRRRFQYILVDEYQDTNLAQYKLVRLLAKKHRNVCVVGDDDQSIYGWRGADYTNIFQFEKDFEEAKVIKLEQNYRSTGNILACANAIIVENHDRKAKKLWTDAEKGEKIHTEMFCDEQTEANSVTEEISRLNYDGDYCLNEFAILYRTNAVGRIVQKSLARKGIPFEVYGDVSFYKRKEIKDAFAYLRMLVNPNDEVSLLRIINEPKRGIGQATVDEISAYARKHNETMFGYILDASSYGEIGSRAAKKVDAFTDLLRNLIIVANTQSLTETVRAVIEMTGLKAQYENSSDIEDAARVENLEAFISDAAEYERANEGGTLSDYLESIALSSATDGLDQEGGTVKLMTIHSAKGLEFPVVFIIGMEQGIFPLERARNNMAEMEEERRLCYVGVTRAKKLLYLTAARSRFKNGMEMMSMPSEFLMSIPKDIIVSKTAGDLKRGQQEFKIREQGSKSLEVNRGAKIEPVVAKPTGTAKQFNANDRVRHRTFGEGTVIYVRPTEKRTFVSIKFDTGAVKELDASIAPIEII